MATIWHSIRLLLFQLNLFVYSWATAIQFALISCLSLRLDTLWNMLSFDTWFIVCSLETTHTRVYKLSVCRYSYCIIYRIRLFVSCVQLRCEQNHQQPTRIMLYSTKTIKLEVWLHTTTTLRDVILQTDNTRKLKPCLRNIC